MNIGILGAGKIGGTLGQKWAAAGHAVVYGARDPNSDKTRAALSAIPQNARADSIENAIAFGQVILLAIPGRTVQEALAQHGRALDHKIVIDSTNRFGEPVQHAVDAISAVAPNAYIYRAFNSYGWEDFANPQFSGMSGDLFYCGADDAARPKVEQLIRDIGLGAVYVGGLDQVQVVDGVTNLWATLALRQQMGRHLAFKLLR